MTIPKDVDFIDYDGRLVYSYTAQEFLALEAMPANPSNPGLVAQGWNWTLTDAKEYVTQWGCLVIGQTYATSDGKTRVYLEVPQSLVDIQATLNVRLYGITSGSGTISWGDGSTTNLASGTGNKNHSHVYTTAGYYKIEINIVSGTYAIGYQGANIGTFYSSTSYNANSRWGAYIYKIEIGNNITKFGRQPFRNLFALQSITIPNTVTGFNETTAPDGNVIESYKMRGIVFPSGFQGKTSGVIGIMHSMKYISLPTSITKLGINTSTAYNLRKFTMYFLGGSASNTIKLAYAGRLTHFVLPGDYTTLVTATLQGSMVKRVVVPASVTTIQTEAFMNNYFLELHMLSTTVPTLGNTRAFLNIGPNAVIYVPYSEDHSVLNAYKTATNWATYASYMQEEPQS